MLFNSRVSRSWFDTLNPPIIAKTISVIPKNKNIKNDKVFACSFKRVFSLIAFKSFFASNLIDSRTRGAEARTVKNTNNILELVSNTHKLIKTAKEQNPTDQGKD